MSMARKTTSVEQTETSLETGWNISVHHKENKSTNGIALLSTDLHIAKQISSFKICIS